MSRLRGVVGELIETYLFPLCFAEDFFGAAESEVTAGFIKLSRISFAALK